MDFVSIFPVLDLCMPALFLGTHTMGQVKTPLLDAFDLQIDHYQCLYLACSQFCHCELFRTYAHVHSHAFTELDKTMFIQKDTSSLEPERVKLHD